jgi:hypothetical protein
VIEAQSPPDLRTEPPVPQRRSTGLSLKDIHAICWTLVAIFLAAPLMLAVGSALESGQISKQISERDFVYFYSMGLMLNEYPASQLYSYDLQKTVETHVHPLIGREYSPNPYPPFVGLLFQPFSRMTYPAAYFLWLSISLSGYIAGLYIAGMTFFRQEPLYRSLVFCFGLSFLPFLWIMVGGQIPVIGFIGLVLAFQAQKRRRYFSAGMWLSLCLYKPTLLVLLIPMLLIGRWHRTLTGFIVGAATLFGAVSAFDGLAAWKGYLDLMLSFGSAAMKTHGYRDLRFYMDLFSFSSLVPGGRSPASVIILGLFSSCAAITLVRAWWKRGDTSAETTLIWAATLTWTFVLNLYVPIYDLVALVGGIVATAAIVRNLGGTTRLRTWLLAAGSLIYVGAWISVPLAKSTGLEILTVVVAMFGSLQLLLLRRLRAATR